MENKDDFKYCCMDCGALFQNVSTFEAHEKMHCKDEEVDLVQRCDLDEIEILFDKKSGKRVINTEGSFSTISTRVWV
jgi:DNA-directed RNA polymerase subunit RPC12/RpoP